MSPAFVLGTMATGDGRRAFNARDVLSGLVAGLAVALGLWAAGVRTLHGLHPGVLGLAVNYVVVVASRMVRLKR